MNCYGKAPTFLSRDSSSKGRLDALSAEPPTQRPGRLAFECGRFETLRAGGHRVAVFAERVGTLSRLEMHDPDGVLRDALPACV